MQILNESDCVILTFTLKKKWYDLIATGEKKEEYREVKPYWKTRIVNWERALRAAKGKKVGILRFRLGYNGNAPDLCFRAVPQPNDEYPTWTLLTDHSFHPGWGEPSFDHFVIPIGERVQLVKDEKRRKVKILATSDLHGLLDGLPEICSVNKPDVLVIAGDIHPAIIGTDPDDWFRNVFFPFVRSLGCEVIATPGNHDFWLASHTETIAGIAPKNFHLLLDSEITVCGLRFYGTPWVPWISGHWSFEQDDDDLKDRFAAIPSDLDVLISHSPPKFPDCNLDVSMQRDQRYWQHFGSVSLANAIERAKPRYCVCGHIHSGSHGDFTAPGGTRVFNVSRVNEQYQVYYCPLLLEVEPAKMVKSERKKKCQKKN